MKYSVRFLIKTVCATWLLVSSLVPAQRAWAQAGSCGSRDPSGGASQAGLYAEYYAGYFNEVPDYFNTHSPGLQRIDPQVNFPSTGTWGTITPPAGGSASNPQNFSVRERGEVYLQADTYTFYLTSDDGSYLWIGGDAHLLTPSISNATVSNGGGHASQTRTGTVTISTAGLYDLLLLYGDSGGQNNLTLEYSTPTIARQVIPSSALCTGIRSVPTGLSYSPATQTVTMGIGGSSGTPTVFDGNTAVTAYAITNASSLPAGFSIDNTGVITAGPGVGAGVFSISVAATNAYGTSTFTSRYTFTVNAACGGIDAYGQPARPGLLAEYFPTYFNDQASFFTNNTAYPLGSTTNPALITRTEATPNYTSDDAWQTSGLNLYSAGVATGSNAEPEQFSSRYRGQIYITTPGDYVFTVISDDATYLVVDGSATAQTVAAPYTVSNGGGHGTRSVSSSATTLSAGFHSLVLLYGNGQTHSYLSLQYSGPNIAQQVIPSAVLCTGIVSVPTGLAYSPGSATFSTGGTASSGLPTVYNGNLAVTSYAIANASSLPAGITMDASGNITADATVVPGTYAVTVSVTNAAGTASYANAFVFQVQGVACTGADGSGHAAQRGFYSEYYAGYFGNANGADSDANLTFFNNNAPAYRTTGLALNFTADNSWSANGLNLFSAGIAGGSDAQPTQFSARYRGKLYIATTDSYTFTLNSDDSSYLFLDNAATATTPTIASATISNGGTHNANTSKTATVTLTAGQHDIQVLYGQGPTNSYLKLQYAGTSTSGVTQQVITSNIVCSTVAGQPLPVQLTRFEAQVAGTAVALSWATATELRSAWFVVERSADGLAFAEVGRVAAAGSSAQARQYQLLDRTPLVGLAYYRLRQLDTDNSAHFSPAVTVQVATAAAPLLTLAPNPSADGLVQAELRQATAQCAHLQVIDALGREVYRQELPAATIQQQALDLRTLPAGVYLVRAVSATGIVTQRLVRQ